MPLVNAYADAHLARHVTPAREEQAIAEVAALGTLAAFWVTRLTVLRAYVITCQECMTLPDDPFSLKLSAYRKDYTEALAQARAVQAVEGADPPAAGGGSFFTIPLYRS